MQLLIALIGFLLGAATNLLADSLPPHSSLHAPRCPACDGPRPLLAWSGWTALATGRWTCEYCGTPRRGRALLVEAAFVALALLLYRSRPAAGEFWPALLVASVFLLISIIDIEHRLILHIVTAPSALVIGVVHALDPARGPSKTLFGGLAGLAIVFVLYLLGGVFAWALARARRQSLEEVAFGFGDVTLAGVIGLVVGWPGVVVAIVLGVLAAGAFSLLYVVAGLLRRRYTPFSPIPYGPFLILGACVVYFGGREMLLKLLPA